MDRKLMNWMVKIELYFKFDFGLKPEINVTIYNNQKL